jgi:hypothetical protein
MRRFHAAGAISPQTAVSLDQVGIRDSLIFRYLRSRHVIVEAGARRFYIDAVAEAKFRHRRFVFTAVALGIGIVLLLVLIGMSI